MPKIGLILVEEEDGSPVAATIRLKVPNGTLTHNVDGSVSLDLSGGAIEDKTLKATYFATIGSGTTTGTITKPAGGTATFIMDEWGSGTDALVSTIEDGKPTFISPRTAAGVIITTTFDTDGVYTFSGTPDPAASHAVIFVYTATLGNFLSNETLFESELVPLNKAGDEEITGDWTFSGSVIMVISYPPVNKEVSEVLTSAIFGYEIRDIDATVANTYTLPLITSGNNGSTVGLSKQGAANPILAANAADHIYSLSHTAVALESIGSNIFVKAIYDAGGSSYWMPISAFGEVNPS